MAPSLSRAIEVTVMSAQDLRINRRPVKKNSFVIIRTESESYGVTDFDGEGGSYPSWNQKFELDLPSHSSFLIAEVHCRTGKGNRIVGRARIPVSDFTGGQVPMGYLHFLSYRLRDEEGGKNGIINISVRVKGDGDGDGDGKETGPTRGEEREGIPVVGGGVVTGVPIWSSSSFYPGKV